MVSLISYGQNTDSSMLVRIIQNTGLNWLYGLEFVVFVSIELRQSCRLYTFFTIIQTGCTILYGPVEVSI